MRFFFRSRQFKILVAAIAIIVALSVVAVVFKGFVSPQTNIIGSILTPIQKVVASISDSFKGFGEKISDNNDLILENQQLKEQINSLKNDLLEFEEAQKENEFYEKYLDIKDQHTDFKFEPAMLTAKDSTDPFGSFTIDKGSLNGVSQYDPVITSAGLVGYISEVGLSYAKVTTIMSPELKLGAYDKRTRDVGALSGTLEFADQGQTKFYNLTRNCSVTVGDHVVTSGGGVFPEGLIIGSVLSVGQEKQNSALYAVIEPAVDFSELNDMMVITYFSGQGNIATEADK